LPSSLNSENTDFPFGFYGISPAPGFIFAINSVWVGTGFPMVKRYIYLIQRNWTIKEKVSRRRAQDEFDIEDE